jgi:ATP synthase protein I
MKNGNENDQHDFSQQVAAKEKRKLRSIRQNKRSSWSGLGLFGIVGWTIVVPTLLGAALGIWLDKKYTQSFSWTASLLFVGLVTGCIIAWHWIDKENKEINKNQNNAE